MNAEVLIPLAGISIPIVVVPTVLAFRHAARNRELKHAERMRALELGHPTTGADTWPALAAIAIGAVVPLGSMVLAWLADVADSRPTEEAWVCAGFVGVFGVIGGSVLALRLITARDKGRREDAPSNHKPRFDPDAYDVVSSRG